MEKPVCYSRTGRRPNHEDNFLINGLYLTSDEQKKMSDNYCCFVTDDVRLKVHLFAISDGMGGHNAGEVASRMCVEKLAEIGKVLQSCSHIKEVVAYLQSSIAEISVVVCEKSRNYGELKGMGTTLVLFVICGAGCTILNIGDSRAYHFSNDALIQITEDHTEGQRMFNLGLLTRKELSGFPVQKNLNRYVGYGQNGYILQVDEYYPILDNDVVLLCNDGISDYLPDSRASEILHSANNLESTGKQLVNEAVTSHDADNATVIFISLGR